MINWAGSYHNYSSPPQYGRQEIIVCKESFNVFQLWEDHVRSVQFSAVWPRLCCQYIFMSEILAEALSITIREIDFYLIFLMKWWRWDINRQEDSRERPVQCSVMIGFKQWNISTHFSVISDIDEVHIKLWLIGSSLRAQYTGMKTNFLRSFSFCFTSHDWPSL